MSYLIGFICLFFLFLSLNIDKKIYSPIVLFNFWWGITIFISGIGYFGTYIPSNSTYLIMLVSIISFNFSIIFINQRKVKHNSVIKELPINYYNEEQSVKYLMVLQLVVIVILIKRSIIVTQILLSGMSYNFIRYEYYYANSIMTGYDHLVNNWFIAPTITFSIILVSLMITEKKYNKIVLFLTMLSVGLFAFSSGSRSVVVTFGLAITLSWLINRQQIKYDISNKLKIQLIILSVLLSLIYITVARSGSENNTSSDLLQTVIVYFTAPFIYFERLYPLALQDDVFLFGGAFFGGVIDIFILMMRFIGLDINQMSSYIVKYNQKYVVIGDGYSTYNAFPTMVYTFLYDFGFLGVIIGPLLFGIISMFLYKKMINTKNTAFKGIYIVIALMIYESTMKWLGTSANPWIVIIMFLIFDKISRKNSAGIM